MNDLSATPNAQAWRPAALAPRAEMTAFPKNLRLLVFFLVLATLATASSSHALDPDRAISQYHFQSWGTTEGYPETPVLSLGQGAFGYLWLGTESGLIRFDGLRFSEPRPFPHGAPDRRPIPLMTPVSGPNDTEQALWIGTTTNLLLLDDEVTGALRPPAPNAPAPNTSASLDGRTVLSLRGDLEGGLWIGTSDGLFRLYQGHLESVGLEGRQILAIDGTPSGTLYLGTDDGVLTLPRIPQPGTPPQSGTPAMQPIEASIVELQGRRILHLASTGDSLWAALEDGIYASGTDGWQRRHPGRASVLLADGDGNVWAGVEDQLLRFRSGEENLPPSAYNSEGGAIKALFEDREDALWVATANRLLQLADGELITFTRQEGLPDRSVRAVLESRNQDGGQSVLWVGTDGGGIASIREGVVDKTYSTADGLASDAVLSLAETPPGTLWIGTADAGLSRFREGRFTSFTMADGLPTESVTALLADRAGSLWIGTLGGGLGRLRGSRFETFTADTSGLAGDFVRSLHLANDGSVLVGTDGGLSRWQDDRLETIADQDILAGDLVLSVLDDGDRLWIGTNAGLVRFEEGQSWIYDRSHGLLNETVHQIQRDGKRLWLCTIKGLFGISLEELRALDEGRRSDVVPLRPRGSQAQECNGYSQPASLRSSEGRLWFAAVDGLLSLRPEDLRPEALPSVIIEEILADGVPLSLRQPVRLPTFVRTIDLHVSSSSLRGAAGQSFQFRLAKYSSLWTEPSQRRTMRYTNLGPGTYRFEARATRRGGVEGPLTAIVFEIPLPFYRSAPFILGLILLLTILGRGLYHLRLQQILQRNARLSEKVVRGTSKVLEQKQELDRAHQRLALTNEKLRQANEQLFELDRENTDLLALAAHGLRGPLLNLQGFSAETERALEKLQTVATEVKDKLSKEDRKGLKSALFEETPEALSFIRASTDRMDQLIQAILTLASLGRQKLAPQPLDTEELVRSILRSLSFQVSRSGAQVTVGALPGIVADPHAMRLVFENLLHNAILYLSPDRPGKIDISSEGEGEIVIFQVRDNGIGIDPRNKDLIFKLFGRVAGRDIPGEGMGLAYVRTVLERQGGKIWFRSTPGEGTTFIFSLPRVANVDPVNEVEP